MQTLFNFADATTARSSLFLSTNGEPFTTSRAIAERFGKKHKDVLKRIKNIINDINELKAEDVINLSNSDLGQRSFAPSSKQNNVEDADISQRNFAPRDDVTAPFGRLNFQPSSYLNEQQKQQPEYRLTHDGFALLVMGFTGKEAFAWKIAFLAAFNQMEAEVKATQQRYIHALDMVRPALRPVTESFNQGEPRAIAASRIGKSVNAVTYHRRKARQFGLLAS